ncbi:MAG: L-serine ammonia-lyase, iron-sulfur-dependent subunit beta [Bacillota bacterium]
MTKKPGNKGIKELSVVGYSVYDIIGPVMVGPSSSHTAGAARIGKMALNILGKTPVMATVLLHGSFAATFKGHGTDRALVGGILGMDPDDLRIKNALEIAAEQGVMVRISAADLGDAHPNLAKIILQAEDGERVEILGASTGGGKIVLLEIDSFPLQLSGEYPALVCIYSDQPGMVAKVSSILAKHGINIAFMRVARRAEDRMALMVVETDQPIPREAASKIQAFTDFYKVKIIPPVV